MAERMTFVLDGRDNLSRVFARAGESAGDFHRRVNQAVTASGGDLRAFTQDANGRLRTLDGRFVSAADAARIFGNRMGGLPPMLRSVGNSAGDTAMELGGRGGGGLGGSMMAVAAIAGLSLLPALGAIVPMAAGVGLAVGALALGFKGVGEAAALAGEDKKKYAAALKKLSPEARTFTKELVAVKRQFGGIGKDIQKAMLPGFTQALKSSGPLVKLLGRGMTEVGRGFGQAASGLSRLMKDAGFQREFSTVLRLGSVFVKDLTSGVGSLARGFLKFGAASEPTLRVLSGGIRDLLGKGLTGMFEGLERGIGGTSAFLSGFFSMLNQILPALGRFAGEVARTFGPLLGELAINAGQRTSAVLGGLGRVVRFLAPVFKDLAFGVKSTTQLFAILLPTVKDLGGAILGSLIPAGLKVDEMKGPFQRLSEAIERNKMLLQEGARLGANAILDLVEAGISNLPGLIGMFRNLSIGVLASVDVIVSGLAKAFGGLPGIGEKFKAANRDFDSFRDSYLKGLVIAEQKTREFSQSVLPRLQENRLKMNISNWTQQITTAKAQMKSVPPSKQAELKARITDLQNKIASANRQLNALDGKTATTYIVTVRQEVRETIARRNTSGRPRSGEGGVSKFATGGLVGFPGGGYVRGPGTSTSDSVLARVSNGEYVIKAAAVRRYGARMFDDLNAMRVQLATSTMSMPTRTAQAPAQQNAGGVFEGDLYLDSGQFLGAVKGVVRPMLRESEQQQARRAKAGRA